MSTPHTRIGEVFAFKVVYRLRFSSHTFGEALEICDELCDSV